jgi:hypothetical protein
MEEAAEEAPHTFLEEEKGSNIESPASPESPESPGFFSKLGTSIVDLFESDEEDEAPAEPAESEENSGPVENGEAPAEPAESEENSGPVENGTAPQDGGEESDAGNKMGFWDTVTSMFDSSDEVQAPRGSPRVATPTPFALDCYKCNPHPL